MKKIRRFTLVELFIVLVGVVVAFGLMLLPALIRVREHERVINCTANLSQIGKAFFQYAMSYDDWYPTVRKYGTETASRTGTNGKIYVYERAVDGGKWLGADSCKAFTLLFDAELLKDPNDVICPCNKKISAAIRGQSLSGHVSYQWCDGLVEEEATMFPVAADGANNHSSSSYFNFVRGDGSVGHAKGNRSMKWYEDKAIRDFCRSPSDLPDYSF
jgi:competence protein ComGC